MLEEHLDESHGAASRQSVERKLQLDWLWDVCELQPGSKVLDVQFDFSRGSVTAVYMEGMNEAYRVADSVGDERRKECYGNFVREAADAIIDLQIQGKGDYAAKQVVGGICGSADDKTQRVDRNQHAITALIEAYQLGLL